MGKKESKVKETKVKTERVKIIFSMLILSILFLADLFLMINTPENFVALVVTSVVLVADVYVLVVAIMQESYHRDSYRNEQYENIFKSEKASYLLLRKNFEEIHDKLNEFQESAGIPTEEIIAAEKAIAKVTISRSKENTDAMMNSNDKLLEKFLNFEDKLEINNTSIIDNQRLIVDQANKDIIMKQQEIISGLKEMELSIKNEMLQSIQKVAAAQPQVVMASAMPQMQPMQTVMQQPVTAEPTLEVYEKPEASEESEAYEKPEASEESEASEELEVSEEFEASEELEASEESEASEELEVSEEFEASEESEVKDRMTELEEELVTEEPVIEESVIEESAIEEPVTEEPVIEEPIIEESAIEEPATSGIPEEPELQKEPEPQPEPEIEEIESEQSAAALNEEKPAMPDLSDPNRPMSPEEIAALLANVDAIKEPEAVPAEEIVPEVEPEEEPEKPETPDLSDPNKALSPEEIAALFANM